MPKPVSRRELIRHFQELGLDGPFPGGRHALMGNPLTSVQVLLSFRL
jgi:hypothetical protein